MGIEDNKTRIRKAIALLEEECGIEIVMDTTATRDFVQVVSETGGDVRTHRVYNDGTITER